MLPRSWRVASLTGRRRRAGAELGPVCHQTTALVARQSRSQTAFPPCDGCAKDIIEHAAVPRFLFSGLRSAIPPASRMTFESQGADARIGAACSGNGLRRAHTMQSPIGWSEDAAWKLDYNNIAQMSSRPTILSGDGAAQSGIRQAERNRARHRAA